MTLMPNPLPDPSSHRDRLRLWPGSGSVAGPASAPAPASGAPSPSIAFALEAALEEFTLRWERGESPTAEQFLDRLPPGDADGPLELIYHEFCLRASSGRRPNPEEFARRFPEYRERLIRLIALHDALPSFDPESAAPPSPFEPGDEIGPYRLVRELGRGGFARVFLAADSELEDRLLVVKVAARPSAEHRYLARAPHPHIVQILRERTTEDGFQLIFMPFVGGATLADALAEGRLRTRRPERGADLLTDLDLRSAPEYDAATSARPAREMLARMSYAQAISWVVARLAEALDHAYRRGVTHGDLKPSNILIGGDGQPMLLDFNLSTDWRPAGPSGSSADPGGTLAYMAPERLRAVAEPETAQPPAPAARHRADLYALGLILREALTHVPPYLPPPDDSPRSARDLASRLAAERSSGDPSSRRLLGSIPAGLRVILRRCLAPTPSERYDCASHLAEDLDRWRSGLPLVHAHPPRWVELGRWARRHRKPLIASLLCITFGSIGTAAAARISDDWADLASDVGQKEDELRERARDKYDGLAHNVDLGARSSWHFNRFETKARVVDPAFAERLFAAYDLLDDDAPDFWGHGDLVRLGEPEASNARAWIIEQALIYGIHAARPEQGVFREDRRQALDVLERISRSRHIAAIDPVTRLLRTQLERPESETDSLTQDACPLWLEAYLEGVRAEALAESDATAMGIDPDTTGFAAALDRYSAALSERPDLYWPNYRLGAVAYRLGKFETAEYAYARCLKLRPSDVMLLLGQGNCSFYLGRNEEAVQWHRRLVEGSPRWPIGWRSLALLGARIDRPELVDEGLAWLRRSTSAPERTGLDLAFVQGVDRGEMIRGTLAEGIARDAAETEGDVSQIGIQAQIADGLLAKNDFQGAIHAYSKILDANPRHLAARMNRAVAYQWLNDSPSAMEDYRRFTSDPNASSMIERDPNALVSYIVLSAEEARRGRTAEAIRLAETAYSLANRLGDRHGEAHYGLARAYSAASKDDPSLLTKAVRALKAAREIHPDFIVTRFPIDPLFHAHRAELSAQLGDVEY